MSKIIRRPDFAGGGITKKERDQMADLVKRWAAIAFRTNHIEPDKIIPAIKRLYAVAELKEPDVVIASSPLQMAYAYGAAAALLHEKKPINLNSIISQFTAASNSENSENLNNAYATVCAEIAGKFGLECAKKWPNVYQGGNMWAGWLCYVDAAENVLGLRLPEFEKYRPWHDAGVNGGYRVMHEDFCIVSDFPETIKIDEENRPHCEDGPSHRWRDGVEIYHWHGVNVPGEWLDGSKTLTPEKALTWENVEQRRAACEILGWHNVLEHPSLNPKVIDKDMPHIGTLLQVDLPDAPGQWFLKYQCGTGRFFAESVNNKEFDTALKANAGGNGWRGKGDPMSFIPFIRT